LGQVCGTKSVYSWFDPVSPLAQESVTMDYASRLPNPEAEELPKELSDLGRRIAVLNAGSRHQDLQQAYDQVVESVKRRRRILNLVQEALSQLRLDIKYLMFDLEVTRSERDELRQRLESE
jgi:hypothetical protein